jgi:hypothetical protein
MKRDPPWVDHVIYWKQSIGLLTGYRLITGGRAAPMQLMPAFDMTPNHHSWI